MRFLALLLCLGAAIPGMAQTNLSDLEAPTSPASSIIDLQPSATLTPKTYRAVETALYSNFINSDGQIRIPNDFAVEFTPYWTRNHGLTLAEYLYPNPWQQFIRASSFSLASTQKFALGNNQETPATALGYRTTFYFGNKEDRNRVKRFTDNAMNRKNISTRVSNVAEGLVGEDGITNNATFLAALKPKLQSKFVTEGLCQNASDAQKLVNDLFTNEDKLPAYSDESPDPFLDSLNNMIDDELDGETLYQEFESYLTKRQGLSIDIAAATFINYPNPNNDNLSYLPKWSGWVTPTYRFKDKLSDIQIHGVLRYEWYNTDYYKEYFAGAEIYEDNFDIGLAASFDAKKVTGKFELVGRLSESEIPAGQDDDGNDLYRKEQGNDWQFLGSLNYPLSNQIVLTYTFGNKFDPILNNTGTRVSMLTLNFGFLGASKERHLDLTKEAE